MQITLENLKSIRNISGIYKITNIISGKSYIGQSKTIRNRLLSQRRANRGSLLSKAIIKYGLENFKFEILCYCDKNILDEIETKCISLYNTVTPNGYNIALGGQSKKIVNPSTCKIISDRQKNFYKTRPAQFKGMHHTEETKKYISEINKGKIISDKCRKASSERMKARKGEAHPFNKRIQIDSIEYYSMRYASEVLGIKRSTVKYRCHSENFPNYIIL